MRFAAILISGSLLLVGCGSSQKTNGGAPANSASSSKPASVPADPNEALRAKLSSGLYQLGGTLDSVQAALTLAKDIQKSSTGQVKAAMEEIVDRIDSCGSTLADHNDEPPTLDAVKKDFAKLDDKRLKTIDDVNDTVAELKEIKGMVGGLTGDTNELEDKLTKLAALVDQALEDAGATLDALGGKADLPTPVPDSLAPSASASG